MSNLSKEKISSIAYDMLQDGDLGDFIRGELGVVGCDDEEEWLLVSESIISYMQGYQDTVMSDNNIKELPSDRDPKVALFTLVIFNQDEYSDSLKARKAGNFSEIEVCDLNQWKMQRECIEAGAINYSGECEVDIFCKGKLVHTAGIWNLPNDLEEVVTENDTFYMLTIGCEGEANVQTFVASTEEKIYEQSIAWIDDDVVSIQFKKFDDQQSYLLMKGNGHTNEELHEYFFKNLSSYYWENELQHLTLDTNYKEQLEKLKKSK
jgi:hypothetical protein